MKILQFIQAILTTAGSISLIFSFLVLFTSNDYFEIAVMSLILGIMAGTAIAAACEDSPKAKTK